MAQWDAAFLGRKTIDGIVNSSKIAKLISSLVERKNLFYKSPKYLVSCSRLEGIQLSPLTQLEDEGFESETEKSSTCSSADSSTTSDLRQTDRKPHPKDSYEYKSSKTPTKLSYHINDVSFCHIDRAFPKILVLCVNNKTKSDGRRLEVIVLQFKSEGKLKEVCRRYNELRKEIKLDFQQSIRRSRESYKNVSNVKKEHLVESKVKLKESEPLVVKYIEDIGYSQFNLVQRTDDDGVTHIEVAGSDDHPEFRSVQPTGQSSIISINTPDSGIVVEETASRMADLTVNESKEIESVIRADVECPPLKSLEPPVRPERRKTRRPAPDPKDIGKSKVNLKPESGSRKKIISGMFISVTVDPKNMEPKSNFLFDDTPGRVSPSSRSSSHISRSQSAVQTYSFHHPQTTYKAERYFKPTYKPVPKNSLSNKFFGKLKEIAGSSNSSSLVNRRSSSGDLSKMNFSKYVQSEMTKSSPNLKSVIKNRSRDGHENSSTKKVTFSAYATVQVVD